MSTAARLLQEGPDPKYLKMIAGLKHFDAYSVEVCMKSVKCGRQGVMESDLFPDSTE